MEQQIERIDGTDYIVGSREHGAARRMRDMRLDQAYLAARQDVFEANLETLRQMRNLNPRIRADANATAFLARELVFVRATVERTIYEALRAASFIPVEGGHPRGAKSYSTVQWDETGEAKVSDDLAGDAPRADVKKSEDLRKYVNVRGSYAYSVQDLDYAAFSGTSLDREKAIACANMIARGVDKIGRVGSAEHGLTGLFNNPNVTVHTLTIGDWLNAARTFAEIQADFNELEDAIIAASRDTQDQVPLETYGLVLPTKWEGRLATMQVPNTQLTAKQFLLMNARIVRRIDRWIALDDAVSPDVAAADPPQGLLYPRHPACLFWPIPIMYEEQAPEIEAWEYLVQARARVGGVEVRRPPWALYIENLD